MLPCQLGWKVMMLHLDEMSNHLLISHQALMVYASENIDELDLQGKWKQAKVQVNGFD